MKFSGKRLAISMLPVLMGILAFLIVVGPRALNPMNIAWLDGGDPATHYLGWVFFRNAPWSFPLGLNPSYGLELGNAVIFSDSNPLFALIFKPFAALLPEPFQYFGLWFLTCFILQSWFAWKLMGLVTANVTLRLLGAGLFLFTPAMIARLGIHLSLAGHFLILAAVYLALRPYTDKRRLAWGALLATTALVHAYLLAMVALIWIADLVAKTLQRHLTLPKALIELVGLFLLVSLCCWQAGYFSVGGSGVGTLGYGLFRANVLTFFDAGSWSYVLNAIPGAPGDSEGFAFPGLGGIFLGICALLLMLQGNSNVVAAVRRRPVLLIALLGLALFAVSNKVGIGAFEFDYPLPEFVVSTAGIFRASGRMIWPVMYVATFAIIYVVVRGHTPRTALVLLAIALVIQVADTRAGWAGARKILMVSPAPKWNTPLVDSFWQSAASHYQKVRWVRPQNLSAQWLTLADYAGTHRLGTDAVYLGRVSTVAVEAAQRKADLTFDSRKYDTDSLYVLDERALLQAAVSLDSNTDVLARIDGLNVLAPGWKQCADCPAVNAVNPLDLIPLLKQSERMPFQTGSPATAYLAKGWSANEPWGTWSEGSDAEIILRPTADVHSLLLETTALLAPTHLRQSLEVRVNEVRVLATSLIKPEANMIEIALPAEVKKLIAQQGVLRIQFHLANAISPRELGMSEDSRKLAIGLQALTVQ
ncbi:DUF6311 domain-containing protein [Pseudomonas sp. 6D_7.1_Bac1]|uniref:DUF6311 domain-containing protein n=1 Tax=Pseudomonas sp. 6D_7.1_Bac1 TaxID=2971615 RepID=UPI0021C6CBA9|nr:DUF6311 domain-containing protein [Pseudomonas sp. 6D_7.1_Bac1]MCU1750638.1 DUF6311 domain-containing protein [Pseudomonas sp. 6D_7.1_Bac1]